MLSILADGVLIVFAGMMLIKAYKATQPINPTRGDEDD